MVPLPAHWFYALARSVWVDHLPRGRLGVVAGARLGPLVAGGAAAGLGPVVGSVACLTGVRPIEATAASMSRRVLGATFGPFTTRCNARMSWLIASRLLMATGVVLSI